MLRQDNRLSFTKLIAIACAYLLWHSANATVITFDELDSSALIDEHGDLISLTDQYAHHGITFNDGAYLLPWEASTGKTGNYISGPGTTLLFSENLPTHVSLMVGNFIEYVVELSAYGPQFFQFQRTTGLSSGISVEPSDLTPYTPDQFIHFTSPTGISSITISGQAGYYIDTLTFFYGNQTIPEPSTFLLLGAGLIGLILSRRRVQNDAKKLLTT